MFVPEAMPEGDLEPHNVSGLVQTLTGVCNESTCTRAEIIGALETVKHTLLMCWHDEDEGP